MTHIVVHLNPPMIDKKDLFSIVSLAVKSILSIYLHGFKKRQYREQEGWVFVAKEPYPVNDLCVRVADYLCP